jgi:hypothetical protein
LAIVLAAAGCGDPPTKEMNQAQGAIDAARAAGAEQYAADEYKAAVDALRRAQDAVTQRDYRQALNDALDSRERAQNAAREASSQKAQARSQAERLVAEVTTALAAANGRLEAARAAKVPAKSLQGAQDVIASTQRALQEAGTALGQEDYLAAQRALADRAPKVRATAAQLEQILSSHGKAPHK